MLLQASSCSSCALLLSPFSRSGNVIIDVSHSRRLGLRRKASKSSSSSSYPGTSACARVGIDGIAEIVRNKVIISAAVSAAIGQLSKPFTAAIFSGNRVSFNFKASFQSGGFPSTHSSTAVATATALGLERGFSDAVFGLAAVYAALIMFDAQGVRREVGIHAKTLNRLLLQNLDSSNDAEDLIDLKPRKSYSNPESLEPLLLEEANFLNAKLNANLFVRPENSNKVMSSTLASDDGGKSGKVAESRKLLKESVGHNEIEVIAGAFLGFLVSLAVYTVI
ncbi:uncharacterized protein LOC127812237 isoform X1 [Diospyros lotus]|uniref:uncharacterized protein LOC127812237 isoform X1 n=1 Tax=Diospyros lotus TaxID=55363 RepID=UPI00225A350B|nr:uncharacterized protein LOC127812237 isoform X1 [Diospyros lotus]